jgi:hypothetical protein
MPSQGENELSSHHKKYLAGEVDIPAMGKYNIVLNIHEFID